MLLLLTVGGGDGGGGFVLITALLDFDAGDAETLFGLVGIGYELIILYDVCAYRLCTDGCLASHEDAIDLDGIGGGGTVLTIDAHVADRFGGAVAQGDVSKGSASKMP